MRRIGHPADPEAARPPVREGGRALGRRGLLAGAAAAVALLGIDRAGRLVAGPALAATPSRPARLGAFLEVTHANRVVVHVGQAEVGQGSASTLAACLADELGADWEGGGVEVRFGSGWEAFEHPALAVVYPGEQITGGSVSVVAFVGPLRKAGAAARWMLREAAAREWRVPADRLAVERGHVVDQATGKRLAFAQVAGPASRLAPPGEVPLKPDAELRLLGKPVPRLDIPPKVFGTAAFSIDVERPGMLHAAVRHAPAWGGEAVRWDAGPALAIPGVVAVERVPHGIAVVADTYWRARKALDALDVEFSTPPERRGVGSAGLLAALKGRFDDAGGAAEALRRGDARPPLAAAGAGAARAEFAVPHLAHAAMEPMNCTADVRADGCEVWVGTQAPTLNRRAVAALTGLPEDRVTIHPTYIGGGFGRKGMSDEVAEAVTLSRAVGRPVKVVWSREEDIRADYLRPMMAARLEAALGPDGLPAALRARVVGPGVWASNRPDLVKDGLDALAVEGLEEIAYDVPNAVVDYVLTETPVRIGYWRSIGYSHNTFFLEAFVDELAHRAGEDPYRYRRRLLAGDARSLAVLDAAAARAGWGRPPPGRHLGIAFFQAKRWGCRVAQVVEVSAEADGRLRVHRLVCAADIGRLANPDAVEAQMQGGALFGLAAALTGRITLADGAVEQSNFHDYPVLVMADAPRVDVELIQGAPEFGSAGEVAVSPAAPALANAVFAATGRRVRELPVLRDPILGVAP